MHKRVDEDTFNLIKRKLIFSRPRSVAAKVGVSLKTVLQVKGSKTLKEYKDQCRAQHPPQEFSLAQEIMNCHRKMYDKQDGEYIQPPAARTAIIELKEGISQL